jgi:hypothetical protein
MVVNSLNPGFCYSDLRRHRLGLANSIFEWLFARTAEEGSRQLVWASVGIPEGGEKELRGAYIHLSRVVEPSDFVLGENGRKREDKLWVRRLVIVWRDFMTDQLIRRILCPSLRVWIHASWMSSSNT